jgi:hypothetical protein
VITDIAQLIGLAVLIVGVWLMAPAGLALVFTGLAIIGAALLAEYGR